jgi:hypothetical protein
MINDHGVPKKKENRMRATVMDYVQIRRSSMLSLSDKNLNMSYSPHVWLLTDI